MAKSNRRRKQDRAKRQSAAARRNAGAQRRRAAAELQAEVSRRHELLQSVDTPVEVIAETLRSHYGSQPGSVGIVVHSLSRHRSAEEVLAVAEVLRDLEVAHDGDQSLFGLALHAQACHLTGDHTAARRLMDEAFVRADEDSREDLVWRLRHLGRAVEVVEYHAAKPELPEYDWEGSAAHRYALEQAATDVATRAADETCPCGLGKRWADCCGPRTAAAVEHFVDRSRMRALRAAVEAYLPGSAYEKPVAAYVEEWLDVAAGDSWDAGVREELAPMAYESAWLLAHARDAEGDPETEDNVLAALTEDPATAPEVARWARGWLRARYGLWQVIDPTPTPGISCMEVCTGQEFYISFAPEQIEGLPRWAVLMGPVVPLDGAWRAGTMMQLAPDEADALCVTVQTATEVVLSELLGRGGGTVVPPPFGQADPHTVYAYSEEPAEPEAVPFVNHTLANLVARLVAEVRKAREVPPGLANTDGDPMRLIRARIAVRDGAALASRLEKHPDFQSGAVEDGRFVWLGKEIPPERYAVMLAELRAQGHEVLGGGDAPRWAQGTLDVLGDELAAEINSDPRLSRLLDVLAGLGAEPVLLEQTRLDPRQDLPWPGGHRGLGGGLHADPGEGWERHWLDEPVPALTGLTPRQAAAGPERDLLEALLRQFEYAAGDPRRSGGREVDTSWLRQQLGMDDF